MKKLLSIIVTVAMLVSCMVPALSVSAADAKVAGLEVAVENVTFDPNGRGDVLTATATVSIVNNPGFAEATWYLYATNTEMNITEVKDVQDLADGENGMSIEVATNKSTTLGNAVKNAFAAAGVATGSTVKTAVVSMITADGESDVTYTGDFLEVTFEIAKDKADIVEGDAFTFGLIPGVDGVCYNVEGEEVVFAPLTGTVTAYTDPNAPEYADKKFDNFTFFVDDVVVKPGVDTVTVGLGFDGTNADFEKYGLLSVEIGFVYPESFKIIDCYKGTAMDPAATETAVQELTEGGNYYVATAPARLQEIFASSGYNAEGKTDKYVYQVHFSTGEDLPSYEGGYINYFVLDVSGAEPGTYELPIITEGTVMGYDATADYKYPQWTADYDLDAGHVTVTAEETECTHENVTTTTVDATCTADGSVTITCDDCGETISTEVLKSEGHKAGDKVTAVEPTYDAEGKWVINCKVCGEELESGSIPALVPEANATVTLGDAVVTIGEQAKVELAIDGSDYFIAIFDVTYDVEVLDFVEFAHNLGENVIVNETADGVIRIYIEAEANADIAAGVAGTLVFNTLDYGTANVDIDVVDLVGYDAGDINYTAEGATVKVVNPGTIAVGDVEVEVEETVKVPVSVENNTGIWAGRVEIEYNTDLFDFVGIESALFEAIEGENYSVNENGVITYFFEAADMNDVAVDGVLFNVVLKAKDVESGGVVYVTVIDLINVAGEDLNYSVVPGNVTITPCSHKSTTTDKVDATVDAEGYIRETCDKCHEIVSETVLPKLTAIVVDDRSETVEEWSNAWAYICIKNNPGYWAARLEITLDEGLSFDALYGYAADLVKGENYSVDGNVITVFIEAADMANIEGDNFILGVSVRAEEVGTYGVSVKVLDLINVDGEDIDAVAVDGTVTFVECTHSETYENKVDATVDAEGYIETICSNCGEVIDTTVLPKLAAIVAEEATTEMWDTGAVNISIVNNPGIWAARLVITFTEGANFLGLYGADFTLEEGVNYSVDGNVVTVFIENDDMVNFTGEFLFSACFGAKEDTVAGDVVDVSIEVLDLINVDGDDIAAEVTNGKLTFTECTHKNIREEKVDATVDAEGYIKTYCYTCGEVLEMVVLPKLAVIEMDASTNADIYTGHYFWLNVKNNPGIWALRLEIAYDANAFDFAYVNSGAFNFDETNYSINDGVITIFVEYDANEDYIGSSDLFGICLSPKNDAAVGTYPVTLTVVEAINYAGEDVALEAVGADFVIVEHTNHKNYTGTVIENEVAADCVNDGSYDVVTYCDYCNVEISRETVAVPALGHTEGEAVIENEVAADCTTDGSYDTVVYCTVCGEEISRETTTVPALGHKEGDAVIENEVAADCTTDGSYDTVVYCTVCGEEISRVTTTVPALGHTDGEWVVEKHATATETGLKVLYCAVCGEKIAEEIIPVFESNGILGFYAESVVLDGDRIDVVAKKDAIEVDFALDLPEGATVEVPEEVYVAFDGNQHWYRSYPGLDSYELVVTFADGTVINYTVYVHFSFSAYVPVIIPGWSASDVQVNGDVIDVTVLKDVTEVDFALDLPAGATAEAFGNVSAIYDGNDTWYRVYNGTESFTLVVTLADGTEYTFTVNVNFDVETYEAVVTPGWSADSAVLNGNVINVVVKENIQEVDFALNIPEGATVTVTDGVQCIFDGHDTWYRVYFGAGLDTFEITVTLANGTVYTYTVNVTFNVEKFDAEVMGGWSASNVAINGNTITVDVIAGVDVVDFAITNLPEGATATVSDNATVVFDGHDYWYGVARGAGDFTVTVTLASGVNYVYTVIANFN